MGELIEKYDPEKIELIRMKLENSAKSGTPEYYEILVDEMPVVKRTNDLSLFDTVQTYMSKGIRKISFRLFGTAPKGWRHVHRSFVVEEVKSSNALSGLEIKAQIDAAILAERERWETEQLKKELENLKVQLKEAEDYIEELEDGIETIKNEKTKTGSILGEAGSLFLENLIRKSAKSNKVMGSLAGLLGNDDAGEESHAQETKASFEKVSDDDNGNEPYVQILRKIEEKLNEEQLTYVMGILEKMMEEPENILPVAELLNLNK